MRTILVLNAGSSSLKFSLFSAPDLHKLYMGSADISEKIHLIIKKNSGEIELDKEFSSSNEPYKLALHELLQWLKKQGTKLSAAGHRIVHGGKYSHSVLLDEAAIETLEKLIPFSPLHQPYNLNGIALLQEEYPDLLQVGCFDTSFHSTMNPIFCHYALPPSMAKEGIKRYGFHGLSYAFIASKLPTLEKEAEKKFLVAHLGSGSTLCAMENLKSVASTTGFSGMGGIPMSTRCGEVDPCLAIYLLEEGYTVKEILNLFYKKSGLLGVSGISADMRTLLTSKNPNAKFAIDLFVNRILFYAGALTAELQGIDGFVFTGGIGTHSWEIREKICQKLSYLGFSLNKEKNKTAIGSQKISQENSKPIWVIPTDEEIIIAKDTLSFIAKEL